MNTIIVYNYTWDIAVNNVYEEIKRYKEKVMNLSMSCKISLSKKLRNLIEGENCSVVLNYNRFG